MSIIRKFLGSLIVLIDAIFSPRQQKRSEQEQSIVDQKTAGLKLYQFNACPFCVKVRRTIKRMSLNIELRDAKNDQAFRDELQQQGGRIKVPCLRITDQHGQHSWLYESSEIIKYLQQKIQA